MNRLLLFLGLLLLVFSSCSGIKTASVRNLDDTKYLSLTYSITDSNYLISTEDSSYYYRFDSLMTLPGFHAQLSPNRKDILTLEAHEDSSYLHLFNREGEPIRSIRIPGEVVDAVYSRKSKRMYALVKPKDDLNGRLLCIRRHGAIEFNVNIGLPKNHLTTLSFEPRRKWILVGDAVQGIILNKKGQVLNSFNTPHFCYTATHRHKVFSILHQYSDGAALELFKTPGQTIGIVAFRYNELYPLPNSRESSSKSRIRCWDVDENILGIVAIDQSPFLQVYRPSGEVHHRQRIADDVKFCFFLSWNTVMLYHAKTNSFERVILPD